MKKKTKFIVVILSDFFINKFKRYININMLIYIYNERIVSDWKDRQE